jgi:hypothetical protein
MLNRPHALRPHHAPACGALAALKTCSAPLSILPSERKAYVPTGPIPGPHTGPTRVRRLLPLMVTPGFDPLLTRPATKGTGGHRWQDPLLDRHRGQFFTIPSLLDLPRPRRIGTGQGRNLRPHYIARYLAGQQ